jgi:Fur family transcriptional regulator, zinc uptake regulator
MAQKHDRPTTLPHQHDHRSCMSGVEARADAGFATRGMKMTPLRRQVLATIAASHDAVGAYEIVERMARKGGRRLAPISVYRIIDSLMDIGVVHKLESRQAYYACHGDHEAGRQVALICRACAHVAEIDGKSILATIKGQAGRCGFRAESVLVEVLGLCRRCEQALPSHKGGTSAS